MRHSPEDAEDIAQEAIRRALDIEIDERGPLSYLHAVAGRVIIDRHRENVTAKRSGAGVSIDDEAERLYEPLSRSPHENATIAAVLSLLRPDTEEAVRLAASGYSYVEAAAIQRVPIATYKSRLSRGRSRLRSLLEIEE